MRGRILLRFRHFLPLLAIIALWVAPASAWYPNGVLAEDITATWCQYCPAAYAGLEANKGWFDRNEFNALRYYANSGSYSCAKAMERIGYYTFGGYPTVIFNGYLQTSGAGDDTATGAPYRAIIESQLADPTYFKLTLNSASFAGNSATVDFDIEVMQPVPDSLLSRMTIRIIAAQDSLDDHGDILQDVTVGGSGDIPLTVSAVGEVQNVNETFPVSAWGPTPHHLEAIAFIQDDASETIYGSLSTHATPPFSLRYYALGERNVVGPVQGDAYHYDTFRVFNTGTLADNYTVSVALEGPPDWTAILCDAGGGICYGPTWSGTLTPGQSIELELAVTPPSSGYGIVTVTMTQDGYPYPGRELRYLYLTDDLEILLVDDDGAESYEDYFIDALEHHGYSYGLWDRNAGAASAAILNQFDAVVWNLGWAFPTLDATDRANLTAYLEAGGRLFITGQDLGWEMQDIGGAAYQWYRDYLHATFVSDDTNLYGLSGVSGDPISDGLDLVIQGGDGADNQDYPSDIDPSDGTASVIWTYSPSANGAIKADTGTYRVVYLAFGFEAINNATDRRLVLDRSLQWLLGTSQDAGEGPAEFHPTLSISPNPVQAAATLRFTLPRPGATALRIYGLDGRLVRTLVDRELDAGYHKLAWDRTDEAGRPLPAGVYYYRLEGEALARSGRVVLLK